MEIEGRVAVVTGGGGGIGRALASALAEGGAKVLLADLDGDAVAAAAEAIGRTRSGAACADVASESELASLIEVAERGLGAIDLFVANAGIAGDGGLSDDDTGRRRSRST